MQVLKHPWLSLQNCTPCRLPTAVLSEIALHRKSLPLKSWYHQMGASSGYFSQNCNSSECCISLLFWLQAICPQAQLTVIFLPTGSSRLSKSYPICFSSSRKERHGFFPTGSLSVGSSLQLYTKCAFPFTWYLNWYRPSCLMDSPLRSTLCLESLLVAIRTPPSQFWMCL